MLRPVPFADAERQLLRRLRRKRRQRFARRAAFGAAIAFVLGIGLVLTWDFLEPQVPTAWRPYVHGMVRSVVPSRGELEAFKADYARVIAARDEASRAPGADMVPTRTP